MPSKQYDAYIPPSASASIERRGVTPPPLCPTAASQDARTRGATKTATAAPQVLVFILETSDKDAKYNRESNDKPSLSLSLRLSSRTCLMLHDFAGLHSHIRSCLSEVRSDSRGSLRKACTRLVQLHQESMQHGKEMHGHAFAAFCI